MLVKNSVVNWIVVLVLTVFALQAAAEEWRVVGTKGFVKNWGRAHLETNSSGTPFVAYLDGYTSHPEVKKFDGTSWVDVVNDSIYNNSSSDINMAIDDNGNLCVVYSDYDCGYKLSAKMLWNGSEYWYPLGDGCFTDGSITSSSSISIAVFEDTVYVAYLDQAHDNNATVKKNVGGGSDWVTVGTEGFSDGEASNITVEVDSTGTPYVSFEDGNSGNASVMKFDGTSWVAVGDTPVVAQNAMDTSLKIDSKDTPYVAYRDGSVPPPGEPAASVQKFVAGEWSYVGERGFPQSFSSYVSLDLDNKDVPYVAFSDHSAATSWGASVMKFDGTQWRYLGASGFSEDAVDQTDISIADDTVYVLYKDYSADNNLTVMRHSTALDTQTGISPAIISYLLN